jgi:hypothetical protein
MKRLHWIGLIVLAVFVSMIGFQSGRYSITRLSAPTAARLAPPIGSAPSAGPSRLYSADNQQLIVCNIAGIPFSELYEILRAAPRDQILSWAKTLEQLPYSPQRDGALIAFYRTLVQVDPDVAAEAAVRTANRAVRDFAVYIMRKAAPESAWAHLAAMTLKLPHRKGRSHLSEMVPNWSRIDPVATSQFLEEHPDEVFPRDFEQLLTNWSNIDPVAAVGWINARPERQSFRAIAGLLSGWAEADRPAAMQYAIANANREKFEPGIMELSYDLFREAPGDARSFIQSLPAELADAAMDQISYYTTGIFVGMSRDFQLPPATTAKWMITLPPDLWKERIGAIILSWNHDAPAEVDVWLNQLPTTTRNDVMADICASSSVDSPAAAFDLAEDISDPRIRHAALSKFVTRVLTENPRAVTKLKQLAQSSADKTYLLQLLSEKDHAK